MRGPFTHPDADRLALDEATAERLLAGDLPPAQAPPGYAEVAALLAATVAPPTPAELAGEAVALAQLRAATRSRQGAGGRHAVGRRARRPTRRRRVGLAVVVAVGALATGGAAAATGHLPEPVREVARSIRANVGAGQPALSTQPGRPAPGVRGPEAAGSTTGAQGQHPVGAVPPGPAAGSIPEPAKDALCHAYAAGNGAEAGRKLDAAAFKALVDLAGGADKIASYCEARRPGKAGTDQGRPPPPDDKDQGTGQERPPPSTGGGGQAPPTTGGQGQGEPTPGSPPGH